METFCLISQRQSVQSVQSTWCHYDANSNTCLNVVRHIEVMEISLWNLFKLQSKPTFRDDLRWHGHCILTHRIILYSPRVLIDLLWLLSTFLKQTLISKDGHTYLTDSFKCSRFIIIKLCTWNTPKCWSKLGNLFIILLLLLSFAGGGGIWKQLVVFVNLLKTCIILLSLCNLSCNWPTRT